MLSCGRSASSESRAARLRSGLSRGLAGRHAEFSHVRQYADSKFTGRRRVKGRGARGLAPRAAASGDEDDDGESGDNEDDER